MNQNYDVFISYRRSDGTALARVVKERLEKRGFRVFLDERDLPGGQDFDKKLEETILATPNYILIATPDVFRFREKNDWVLKEIQIALRAYNDNPQNRRIYPIIPKGFAMPEADTLPEDIRGLHLKNGLNLRTDLPTDDNFVTIARVISAVNRYNMWNAGQRWLSASKAPGRRFHTLHIEKRIMPFASDENTAGNDATLPIRVHTGENKGDLVRLDKALTAGTGHVYLIGEGGIGKTTAMIHLMEEAYEKSSYSATSTIPLFVELNRAPELSDWYRTGEKMQSTFIRREIARILLSLNNIVNVPGDYIDSVDKEFSKKTTSPEYWLLLDGLNEVSTEQVQNENGQHYYIRTLIIDEIQHLLTDCPNVRVMLTSRTDETEVNCTEHSIEKLYLTGLNKESIRKYLDSKDYSEDSIKSVLENEALVECIKIPLFLTMYADLSNSNGVASRGEILRQFFHERGENIAYTQQKAIRNLKFNQYHLWFILDFLLPAIASEMERIGEFELNARKIGSIIEPILKGWKPSNDKSVPIDDEQPYEASVIGEYGKGCFDKYTSGRSTVETVAEEILVQGRNMTKVAEYVLYNVVDVLRIMYRNKNEFGFIHHHFRDFFAAAHDVNLLRIALSAFKDDPELAFESLASFRANANHQEKSIFIGEMLGEHHNKPYLIDDVWHYNVPDTEDDRNLLKRTLDIFRGRFDDDIGYGVYNLIDPIKLVRQDLSGADLSMLDLSFVSFNGIYLGHTESGGANLQGTNLQGAKIGMENLLCQGHSRGINCIVVSPDGNTILSGSSDNTIKEWDSITGQCICTYFGHSSSIKSIAFAKDGKTFLSSSRDKTVKEWDRITKKCTYTYAGHKSSIPCVIYTPDNKTFLSGSGDKTVKEWDMATRQCIRTYVGHSEQIQSIACAPDGKTFISGSGDNTIKEWDRATGRCIRTYFGHNDWVTSVAYAPDGNTFISGSGDNSIKEWDTVTGKCICTYKCHSDWVNSVAYAFDGKTILSGSGDCTVKEWDRTTGQCTCTFEGHKWSVTSVMYTPDKKTVFSCSGDRTIKKWDRVTKRCIRTCDGQDNMIYCLAYSPDGKYFLSGSGDATVKEWNIATGQCFRIYANHRDKVTTVSYALDGKTILSGSEDTFVKEWNTATGQCIHTYEGHNSIVTAVKYSQDGKTFFSAFDDCTVMEWNKVTKQCIRNFMEQSDSIIPSVYAPDGKTVLSWLEGNNIKEWDTSTGQCIRTYVGHSDIVTFALFSPNGRTILTGAMDKTIKEWDRATGQCIYTYAKHKDSVTCIAFAPDGKTFLSGSDDHTIIEWDRSTGQCIHTYTGHRGRIAALSYLPNDQSFLSESVDKTVKEWNRATGHCTHTYVGHSTNVTSVFNVSDGKTFLVGYGNNTIKEWNKATGQCIHTCERHSNWGKSISCSSDGKTFLSGDIDGFIKEWDRVTGQCIHIYTGHSSWVTCVAYAPNNNTFISGDIDGTIKEWNKATEQCIRTYMRHKVRTYSVAYSPDKKTILSGFEDGTIIICSTETGKCLHVIRNYPGLIVLGCDMRNLHKDSSIDKDILRQYGAIVD